MDKRVLRLMAENYAGGPVGLGTIAIAVGEEADTLEEVHEPFLIQEGYLAAHRRRAASSPRRATAPSALRPPPATNSPCCRAGSPTPPNQVGGALCPDKPCNQSGLPLESPAQREGANCPLPLLEISASRPEGFAYPLSAAAAATGFISSEYQLIRLVQNITSASAPNNAAVPATSA
jgi:hypothetical protein